MKRVSCDSCNRCRTVQIPTDCVLPDCSYCQMLKIAVCEQPLTKYTMNCRVYTDCEIDVVRNIISTTVSLKKLIYRYDYFYVSFDVVVKTQDELYNILSDIKDTFVDLHHCIKIEADYYSHYLPCR